MTIKRACAPQYNKGMTEMNQSVEGKITPDDLRHLQTDRDIAINLIKHYARQYNGGEHYNQLGSSCVMSAVGTINSIINSTQYLSGMFFFPDEIHIERLVDFFLDNQNYDCDKKILTFFMADYLRRKINELYRDIKKNKWAIMGDERARTEYEKKVFERLEKGLKQIRL